VREGYLVFTTHDGDEIDANFLENTPSNKAFFDDLLATENDDDILDKWVKYENQLYPTTESRKINRFWTQTRCNEDWPFNDVKILKVYYLLVY